MCKLGYLLHLYVLTKCNVATITLKIVLYFQCTKFVLINLDSVYACKQNKSCGMVQCRLMGSPLADASVAACEAQCENWPGRCIAFNYYANDFFTTLPGHWCHLISEVKGMLDTVAGDQYCSKVADPALGQ